MTNTSVQQNIVITGASAGIGQALALAYAGPGVVLGLIGRDAARLEASAQACRSHGAQVLTGGIDVRQADALKTWLDNFDEAHPIDLLIANAGVATSLTSLDGWEDLATITENVETNLYGSLHTVLPVIERMRARQRGQIALVASLAALRGMTVSPGYCTSKAALKVWGDSVRPLLKRQGIDLSIILPGFVQTSMCDDYPGNKPKPFMWSAQRAAAYIRGKLAARRPEIAFPFRLYFGMRLLPLFPIRMADSIVNQY